MIRGLMLAASAFALFVLALSTATVSGVVTVTPYEADVNKSGQVNSIDLMQVAQRFGMPVPTATPSPAVPGGGGDKVLSRGIVIQPGARAVLGTVVTSDCPDAVFYVRVKSVHAVRSTLVHIRVNERGGENLQADPDPGNVFVVHDYGNGGTSILQGSNNWSGLQELVLHAEVVYNAEWPTRVDADVHCSPPV